MGRGGIIINNIIKSNDILEKLDRLEIEHWIEEGELWIKSSYSSLSPEVLNEIKKEKDLLMTEEGTLSFWERFEFKLNHHGLRRDIKDLPCIELNKDYENQDLIETYISRRSYRKFKKDSILLDQISDLMSHLQLKKIQGVDINKGIYGSAGSLYPIQTYLYVKQNRIEGIEQGLYYYHPYDNKLILISNKMNVDLDLYPSGNDVIYEASAFVIYFIGKMNAISPVYKLKARDYALIEVGLMSQVLEMAATDNNIGLCQIGGFDFKPLREYFKLEKSDIYLHQMVGGLIDDSEKKLEALIANSQNYKKMSDQLKVNKLLNKLKKNNIELFLENEKLKYRAPKNALNKELISEINSCKKELVQYFHEFIIE